MKDVLMDLHTHSSFSPDATDSAEKMCHRGAELGLTAYGITEHCDCNFWNTIDELSENQENIIDKEMYGARVYATESIAEQIRLKEIFDGRLNFLVGIELGQPLQNLPVAEIMASDPRLDFIIGSHHQNAGKPDFYWIEYDRMDTSQIYSYIEDAFSQTLDMCKWGKFDVLGHLTYPLRYICGEYGIEIDLSKYHDIICEIFTTLIYNGKGIEINTSGLRQKYGRTFPNFDLIKLYKNLGGEIVTVGSDAHCAADIGKGIADGIKLAKAAGFEYLTYFKQHKPQLLSI